MIKQYKSTVFRAKKIYADALSSRLSGRAGSAEGKAASSGAKSGGKTRPGQNRAVARTKKPEERTVPFKTSTVPENPARDDWTARRLSDDCEREARRYETRL